MFVRLSCNTRKRVNSVAWPSEIHVDAGTLRKAFHKPLRRRSQTNLVQERRVQQVGHGPRAIQAFGENRRQIGDDLVIRVIGEMRVRQYLGRAETLSESVVQLSRNAATFFVLRLQKLHAEPARFLFLDGAFAELLREPSIMFPD